MPIKAEKTPNFTATASYWPSLMNCISGHVAKTSQTLSQRLRPAPLISPDQSLQIHQISVSVHTVSFANHRYRQHTKTYTHTCNQPWQNMHAKIVPRIPKTNRPVIKNSRRLSHLRNYQSHFTRHISTAARWITLLLSKKYFPTPRGTGDCKCHL